MTAQEFLNKLQRVQLKIKEDDTPLKFGSYSAIALQSVRIFTDGLDSNGSPIGKYSQKDIWIKDKADPVGERAKKEYGITTRNSGGLYPKKGKGGYPGFKTTDRERVLGYFKGWKGFREAQGLQGEKVDLNYTGSLFLDFCNPQGNIPTTRKVTNHEYVTSLKRPDSSDKLGGNEDHFNTTIRKLTSDEKEGFYKSVRFELRKLINET